MSYEVPQSFADTAWVQLKISGAPRFEAAWSLRHEAPKGGTLPPTGVCVGGGGGGLPRDIFWKMHQKGAFWGY